MNLRLFLVYAIISLSEAKPFFVRNITDCGISENGILIYTGKYSFTRFQRECLNWAELESIYPDVVNKEKFPFDESIKSAENFCRNPNFDSNGPWCYVEKGDTVTREYCHVCQSLKIRLTTSSTETDVEFDEKNPEFFDSIRNDVQRYIEYLRKEIQEIYKKMANKVNDVRWKISQKFNF